MEQDYIIKKYHKKAIRPFEFFSKFFDEKFYENVRPKIEKKLTEVLEVLKEKDGLYLMDKDGWPAERKLELATEPATVGDQPFADFTGEVKGIPCFREGKIQRVHDWLATQKLAFDELPQSYFYSDSMNDLPLLEKVSNPVATMAQTAVD